MRYFNWKLAIALIFSCVMVVVGAVGLHCWQKTDSAEKALALGLSAHANGDYEAAAVSLGRYVAVQRGDIPILMKYADAQTKRRPQAIAQAMETYRTVLRLDAGNVRAAKQLAGYYLAANAAREAELICQRYLDCSSSGDIQRTYAIALADLGRYDESRSQLKALIDQNPHDVTTYEVLGQLAEAHAGKYEEPSGHWHNLAIEKNPTSAYARIARAHHYQKQGENSRAIQELEAAQQMDLTDPNVRLKLATELVRIDLLEEAGHHLSICQEADAASLQLWQTRAQCALKSQSKETMCEVALNGLASLGYNVQDYWPTATELFIAAEQFDQAAEYVAKIRSVEMSPRISALAAYWGGCIANSQGQVHAAAAQWQRAIELGYREPRVRLPLAALLAQLGEMQSALDQLIAVTMEFPSSLNGHVALVRHYQKTNDDRNAQRQAQVARQLFHDNALIQLLELETRINALASQTSELAWQDYTDIIQQLQRRYETHDQYAAYAGRLLFNLALLCKEYDRAEGILGGLSSGDAHEVLSTKLDRARLYLDQEKTEKAAGLLEAMVTAYPDEFGPVMLLASVFIDDDQTFKAIQLLERVYKGRQGPARKEPGLWLSDLYQREERHEEARSVLASLKQALPTDMEIRRQMISLLLAQKRFGQAQALVPELKDIEGDAGKQWRYAQARVWLADDDTGKHYGEIVALLQQSLQLYPKDQTLRLLLASAYEQAGDWRLTVSCYREAYNQSPDDLRVIIPLVNALQKAGAPDEADRVLRRAAELKLIHPDLTRLKLAGDLRQRRYGPVTDAVENALGQDPNNVKTGLFLARLKVEQRQFEEADLLLRQLEGLEPDSPDIAEVYLDSLRGQGRIADMLHRADQLVASLANARSYLLRAEARALYGQIEGAKQDYEQAVGLDPNQVNAYVCRARFYQNTGQHEQALLDIDRALTMSPEDMSIRSTAIELGLRSPNKDRQQEARQALKRALKDEPEDPSLLFIKARLLVREGTRPSIDAAEQILGRIAERHPAEERAWHLRAQLLLNRGQSGRALDTILSGLANRPNSRALLLLKASIERTKSSVLAIQTLKGLGEMYPTDAEVALRLASLYTENKDVAHAVAILEKQLKLSPPPEKTDCAIALALILHGNGQAERAQTLLSELEQDRANAAKVFRARAQIWIDNKRWDEFRAGLRRWQDEHADGSQVLTEMANVLTRQTDREALVLAEELLGEIINASPDWAEPKLLLGHLLYGTKRIDEAGLQYQQVLENDPNNLIAINNCAWFLCEEKKDYAQALALADRGLKLAPKYVDLLDTRGTILYRMKRFDKADEDFRRSIQLCPPDATTGIGSRFRLARVYAKMGRRTQAVRYLEESLQMHAQIYQSRGKMGLSDAERFEAQQLLSELKSET